jgi:hypothetical protein
MTEKRLDLNRGKSAEKPNVKCKQISEFSTFHAKMERFVDAAVSIYNAQQSGKGGTKRQAAHNSGHMLRTAKAGYEYVDSVLRENTSTRSRIAALSIITGLLHDLVRAPREVNGRSDGIITADVVDFLYFMKSSAPHADSMNEYRKLAHLFPLQLRCIRSMLLDLSPIEVRAISDAIRVNEGAVKDIMKAVSSLKESGESRNALLQEALLYGDKGVEGMGKIVVIRRFQFVSGERCENPDDISAMKAAVFADGFSESDFRALAFIGESMIRIYSNKSLDDFPNGGLWDSAKADRGYEEMVYRALLKIFLATRHQKMFGSEADVFGYLLERGFPKLKQAEANIMLKMKNLKVESPEMKCIDYARIGEVFNFGIALAYSQSRDPQLVKESAACANLVSCEDLKSALKETDSGSVAGAIKERIRSLFID